MRELTEYDVVVVGGGPGGIGAAIAAARGGAKALLIERAGYLGGAATTMMVNPFMADRTKPSEDDGLRRLVNGGIYQEMLERLKQRDAAIHEEGGGARFDDEILKVVLDEMVTEAGVTILFHAALYDAETENGRVKRLLLAHNGGPIAVSGRVFIDCTGDGLLAARAGVPVETGDAEGNLMPMTLFFCVGGVDLERWPGRFEIRERVKSGEQDTPALINRHLSMIAEAPNGLLYFNAVRISGNPLEPLELSACEVEGRKRAANYVEWLRANVVGFEKAWLVKTAPHIGVRETRRIHGDYRLTYDDWKSNARFDDAIACCCYPVDIHGQTFGQTRMEHLPPGTWYQVPYRCMLPEGLENLLVASRCISADPVAHSSLRVMPPIMCLGQAAGHAAALVQPEGKVRNVDIDKLQQAIAGSGGILEPYAVS